MTENVIILIKISLKFVPMGPINNIPALNQIMALRRPGDKPLTESMMVRLLAHICVTRPHLVKFSGSKFITFRKNHVNTIAAHALDLCMDMASSVHKMPCYVHLNHPNVAIWKCSLIPLRPRLSNMWFTTWGPFYKHGLTLISAWLNKHTNFKVWDGVTYPCSNFKTSRVQPLKFGYG